MQFAGIRSDMDLKQIGDSYNVLVKLNDDVLPSPEALLVAYGLLPGYEGITLLKDRCAKYSKQVKRKDDTLADREAAAIEELAIRLLNAYYSGAPLPVELPLPYGGFLLDYLYVSRPSYKTVSLLCISRNEGLFLL